MKEGLKLVYMYLLGGVIMVGFFWLLMSSVYQAVPLENKDILNIAVGALIGMAGGVVNYFYGSSKGSSDKNELLKK